MRSNIIKISSKETHRHSVYQTDNRNLFIYLFIGFSSFNNIFIKHHIKPTTEDGAKKRDNAYFHCGPLMFKKVIGYIKSIHPKGGNRPFSV